MLLWKNDFSRRIIMENTPYLYDTLVHVLRQHRNWLDLRHLKTLAWMMVGLIHSGQIGLCAWAPYVVSRACYSQSTVRRFRRWLDNDRIEVHALYGPLIQQALVGWGDKTLYVALDTSMLWNTYCMVRLSVIYRGRAVPLAWFVIEHGSAAVAYEAYKALLDKAATLMPFACKVVLLADRGFADTDLMPHVQRLGWHFRIRIKSNFWIYRPGHGGFQVHAISLAPGQARFWQGVWLTRKRFGPVHLAVARPVGSNKYWYGISDEPTAVESLEEYGLRFDIEENFLDDKSNGFHLESSLIRSPEELERLCFVLAMTTLYLVSLGTSVVKQGKRRFVDPHWFRGTSYLKIGWRWVSYTLSRGYELIASVHLSSERDPEPAIASRKQAQQRQNRFVFAYQNAA
jgi:Transposase DDE domain